MIRPVRRNKVAQTIFCLLALFMAGPLAAQDIKVRNLDEILTSDQQSDSLEVMSIEGFMKVVLANHPVVRQADLLPDAARQELRLARGAFDPKLEATLDGKHFKDKEYYNLLNTTLKVPTWFPLDPKVSFERNRGLFVNPENSIPSEDDFRQVTAGLSLPVGRGLMIDQRRAAVRQAQLFQGINQAERIKMINKILLSAAKDYWNWYFAYYNFLLVETSLNISEDIYGRVKLNYDFGEAAVVDTVQAAITLQNRQIDLQEARIAFKRSGLVLSNYLWGENQEPLVIGEELKPELTIEGLYLAPELQSDSLLNMAIAQHPELTKLSLKLSQLDIEEQLARENLKPRVDLEWNFINSPISNSGEFQDVMINDNYKFGIAFEFPLFLRKERAKLGQTRIKIDQTTLEFDQVQREILNGIRASYFALSNRQGMLGTIQQAVSNYEVLLQAEIYNLELGESDLFKINFQQDKLLEAQIKLMKMRADVEKARATLYWSAGVPYLNYQPANLD